VSAAFDRPGEAALAQIKRLAERELSPEEYAAAVAVPISPEERAAVLELVEWFGRRYATPAERLAYVRRAYRRWTRAVSVR
jgi:hypothetical protein